MTDMKKKCFIVLFVALLVCCLCSCNPNNEEIEALQQRIADLETKLEQANIENAEIRQDLEEEISLLHNRCNNLTEHDLELLDDIARMESRISKYYHVNSATGECEEHTFKYEIHDGYHIYKCTVCGYVNSDKSHPHDFDGFATNNLTHQETCDSCDYTEGPKDHVLDYEGAGTTKAEWNENFPTMKSLHVSGTIASKGFWAKILFPALPNLKRDNTNTLTCSVCDTTVKKVVNAGNGTGEYQLTYYPALKLECYVEDADEYMLRLADVDGTRFLYLRNYSVTAYNGDVKMHEWKCEGKTFKEWGFESQVWTCIYEGDLDGGTLEDIVDWNGNAAWGTLGYVIEGDVYCMGTGTGNFYDRVSYVATDDGFVERPYGNDITHTYLH